MRTAAEIGIDVPAENAALSNGWLRNTRLNPATFELLSPLIPRSKVRSELFAVAWWTSAAIQLIPACSAVLGKGAAMGGSTRA